MTRLEESLDQIKVTLDNSKKTLAALRIAFDALVTIKRHGDSFSAQLSDQTIDQISKAME